MGPMLGPWILLSGYVSSSMHSIPLIAGIAVGTQWTRRHGSSRLAAEDLWITHLQPRFSWSCKLNHKPIWETCNSEYQVMMMYVYVIKLGHHQLWEMACCLFGELFKALLEENITWKSLSLSLDFFKILLFQVTFLIFFSIAIFSPCSFLQVGLLLQYVALLQSGN